MKDRVRLEDAAEVEISAEADGTLKVLLSNRNTGEMSLQWFSADRVARILMASKVKDMGLSTIKIKSEGV